MADRAFETLLVERAGAVLHVVLARPEVHDAFDERTVRDLTAVFRDAGGDAGVRVVVLRSTGKSFSAGADLTWMRRMATQGDDENRRDADALADMFEVIAACPKPVVARVQGAALGGGAGLVAAADVVVASESARLGFTEVRLGILPAVIAPHVLRKLTPGHAQALFLTGSRFSAHDARTAGLIHRVVPPAELDHAVREVVDELLRGSPEAQAAVKALVARLVEGTRAEARAAAVEAIARARASPDGREGMTAFLEKRRPSWAEGDGS